jgi:hypothetical protein
MSFKLQKRKSRETESAQSSAGTASKCVRKFRRCGGRKPPEEAAGQAGVIVDDDAPASHAGVV